MPDIFVRPTNNKKEEETAVITDKLSGHPHIFSAFCENPIGIFFKDQEKDEKILLFLRRHFITNAPWISMVLILVLIPPLLSILSSQLPFLNLINFPSRFLIFFIIFYYLLVFAYTLVNFITWYFNISIVTQKRIIDIDYSDLVYKNVAETKLSLVEDVSYTQAGVIRTLYDYGDVLVQTAAEFENFDFTAVPHPARVTKIIEDLIGKGHNA